MLGRFSLPSRLCDRSPDGSAYAATGREELGTDVSTGETGDGVVYELCLRCDIDGRRLLSLGCRERWLTE